MAANAVIGASHIPAEIEIPHTAIAPAPRPRPGLSPAPLKKRLRKAVCRS
jgi:hypothetical protein